MDDNLYKKVSIYNKFYNNMDRFICIFLSILKESYYPATNKKDFYFRLFAFYILFVRLFNFFEQKIFLNKFNIKIL